MASFEWILTGAKLPNGGDIIFLRASWLTVLAYSSALGFRNMIDPHRTWEFSILELRRQVVDTLPWAGGVFAGMYSALYARFASQWTYLADVYNQIKATEANRPEGITVPTGAVSQSEGALADWKAGFLEDAEELHLATKPLFASVIRAWGREEGVAAAYVRNTPGGQIRLGALLERVTVVCDRRNTDFRNG